MTSRRVCGVVLGLILAAASADAVEVTTCGQLVSGPDVGVLTADLDCSGRTWCRLCNTTFTSCRYVDTQCVLDADCGAGGLCDGAPAVQLNNARLELAGHTLRGEGWGALCVRGRCEVVGPGLVTGADVGIGQGPRGRLDVSG